MKKLQHPNIVRCEDVVDDGHQMVLVIEYLAGGQLFDQLEQLSEEHYSEKTAAQLFKQVLLIYESRCKDASPEAAHLVMAAGCICSRAIRTVLQGISMIRAACERLLSAQMAGGLKCMHEAGLMNRDVKGENFIFAVEPNKAAKAGKPLVVKMIDLGMAAEYDPKDPIRGAPPFVGWLACAIKAQTAVALTWLSSEHL